MDKQLQIIREFAARAHAGQERRYTAEPYIMHPQRVMETCRKYIDDFEVLAAALLHDVLEDTSVSRAGLHDFLSTQLEPKRAGKITRLVTELTDEYEKVKYPHWNRRKRKSMEAERLARVSAVAQTVKYADILDNAGEIMRHEPGFGRRYLAESKMMLDAMKAGDPELRRKVLASLSQLGGA